MGWTSTSSRGQPPWTSPWHGGHRTCSCTASPPCATAHAPVSLLAPWHGSCNATQWRRWAVGLWQGRVRQPKARSMNKQTQHHSLAEGARIGLLPGVGPFMHHNAGLDSGEVATKPGEAGTGDRGGGSRGGRGGWSSKWARKPATKPHVHVHRTAHVCVHTNTQPQGTTRTYLQ